MSSGDLKSLTAQARHSPTKSLDRRDGLGLRADAPVKNTGKTRYKCLEKHVSFFLFR